MCRDSYCLTEPYISKYPEIKTITITATTKTKTVAVATKPTVIIDDKHYFQEKTSTFESEIKPLNIKSSYFCQIF